MNAPVTEPTAEQWALWVERGTGGHLSDAEIADKVRMLMRGDLDHEAVCVMARDRIKYLSERLTLAEEQRDAFAAALVGTYGSSPWGDAEQSVVVRAAFEHHQGKGKPHA